MVDLRTSLTGVEESIHRDAIYNELKKEKKESHDVSSGVALWR